MAQTTFTISVIICAYTEQRWDDLLAAVESVRQQTLPATETIVVIDHNPVLLERVQKHILDVVVVENAEARGLRGARNSGVAVAKSSIIAFLDDDAVAEPNWLKFLCAGYDDPQVLGTGGAILPLWMKNRPAWLPEEFYWVVGCTYRGMPLVGNTIRNPIGANMSFRREVFDIVGNFNSEIERIGPRHAGGCEETELCIRARQHWPQGVFLHSENASVLHRVPGSRTKWRYFYSRCYTEGLSKAVIIQHVGVKDGLASERAYILRTLPRALIRGLTDTFSRHDFAGLTRTGAMLIGLAATITGYFVGNMFLHIARTKNAMVTISAYRHRSEAPVSLSARAETRE